MNRAAPKRVLRYRRRLRSRIVISFVLLGVGLTTLFAGATFVLKARLENQLIESTLQEEVDALIQQVRANPDAAPAFSMFEAWTYSTRTSHRIPLTWQGLKTGVHDIVEYDDSNRLRHYKLAVRFQDELIGFVRYDVSRAELGARQLSITLAVAVVLLTVLAFLIGLWSSRRVMSPVADLAARLRAFGNGAQPQALAPHFADDEVGQLASAFDDYSDRLTALVRRDREFNADVSHELRTPLAVIRGATELLLTQPDLPAKAQIRLKRIERAVQQCSDLIEALLTLSRSERGHGAADLKRIVEQLVDTERLAVRGKPVELVVEGGDGIVVDAPEAVLAVALGNLIGNAVKYTAQGEVRIRLLPDRVEILDSGPGIDAEEAGRLFQRGYRGKSAEGSRGAGIGLAIVTRLCELYGWQASLAPRPEGGAMATLRFGQRR